jgi:hypothetical protein
MKNHVKFSVIHLLASAALSKKELGWTTATKTTDQVVTRPSTTTTCVNAPNLEQQVTTLNFQKPDANASARDAYAPALERDNVDCQ